MQANLLHMQSLILNICPKYTDKCSFHLSSRKCLLANVDHYRKPERIKIERYGAQSHWTHLQNNHTFKAQETLQKRGQSARATESYIVSPTNVRRYTHRISTTWQPKNS